MPSLFGRRKASGKLEARLGSLSLAGIAGSSSSSGGGGGGSSGGGNGGGGGSRKLQISGPYNFQHVAHTCGNHEQPPTPGLELQTTRSESASGRPQSWESQLSSMPSVKVDNSFLVVDGSGPATVSGISLPATHATHATIPRPPEPLRSGPIRPPGPSRPSVVSTLPPRTSSRQSDRSGSFEPMVVLTTPGQSQYGDILIDRAQAPDPGFLDIPPAADYSEAFERHLQEFADRGPQLSERPSQATLHPDRMPPQLSERPSQATLHPDRMPSGLYLRPQSQHRPSSGASDTLGRPGLVGGGGGAHRAAAPSQGGMPGEPVDDLGQDLNWEADIDYCYEHDANAYFDYEWDRSSYEARQAALENQDPLAAEFPQRDDASSARLSYASMSTTATDNLSDFTAERHVSVGSGWTSLTRFTTSSGTSKNLDGWDKPGGEDGSGWAEPSRASSSSSSRAAVDSGPISPTPSWSPAAAAAAWAPAAGLAEGGGPVPSAPVSEKRSGSRGPGHMSRGSESAAVVMTRTQSQKKRRSGRSSVSSPPPPVQYGLFPRTKPQSHP